MTVIPKLLMRYISLVVSCLLIYNCSLFISGKFVLDKDSRLPGWFEKPANINEGRLVTKILIYEPFMTSSGKVEIEIMDSSRNLLKKKSGKWFWHPVTKKQIDAGNREPPLWIIVEINDAQEIYEQRSRENTLLIVDKIKH